MKKIFRGLLVVLFAYLMVMGMMSLQHLFDRGDMKKAAQVIYQFQPNKDSPQTLLDLMLIAKAQKNPDDMRCETSILSRYEGHVLVECGVRAGFKNGDTKNNFRWMVDVVAGRLEAQNSLAKDLLKPTSETTDKQENHEKNGSTT